MNKKLKVEDFKRQKKALDKAGITYTLREKGVL